VAYDIRSLRRDGNPDDIFETQLFYGDLKAIIKTSHIVMTPYPKFIVHGTRGSFIKGQIDRQEACLKNNIMPDDPLFCADSEPGIIEYINEKTRSLNEKSRQLAEIMAVSMMRFMRPSSTVRQVT
jgi:predicted dehydrogenase